MGYIISKKTRLAYLQTIALLKIKKKINKIHEKQSMYVSIFLIHYGVFIFCFVFVFKKWCLDIDGYTVAKMAQVSFKWSFVLAWLFWLTFQYQCRVVWVILFCSNILQQSYLLAQKTKLTYVSISLHFKGTMCTIYWDLMDKNGIIYTCICFTG